MISISVIAARWRMTPATIGIAMMLLATLLFTVMDSIAKNLTASYPVQQVIWARYFFQFALMLLLIPRLGIAGLLWTRRPGVHIARGLLLMISTYCMITAISIVPLACRCRCSRSGSAGGAGRPCWSALPVC